MIQFPKRDYTKPKMVKKIGFPKGRKNPKTSKFRKTLVGDKNMRKRSFC